MKRRFWAICASVFTIFLVGVIGYGWVNNLILLFNTESGPISGVLILRTIGVILAPIGVVMGYIG